MASKEADQASSSSSRFAYQVFLSFRGEDTRLNFADHLYSALKRAGIHTFRDDDGINRGGNIDEEIDKAIQQSKISIIVFSKGFATSTYCLQEVVKIKVCRKSGHIVLPIFYDVDPSDVREQSGTFADAFDDHERRFHKCEVDCWRQALREVTDLAGMVLGERPQAQFIEDVVKEVGNKLNKQTLYVPSFMVGRDSIIKKINFWLQDEGDGGLLGIIYGIGGVGKTTIAKIVYNLNSNIFDAACFLANVRETAEQFNGLVLLQRQLLRKILKVNISEIDNVDEGVMKIKDAICCKRVLIVLDDIDSSDHFHMIVGMRDWFCPGSKVILTTRLRGLLNTNEVCLKFEVQGLDLSESLQLLSWHAFGQPYPPDEKHVEHCKIVVHHCCGHPLALEVLGRSLCCLSIDLWERVLQEPEAIDNDGKIQKILRISYDSLHHHDKNLFLDIACFFIGKKKSYIDAILKGCDMYRPLGVQNLSDKCLITTDLDEKLQMHQLLRDMGREVVRQESKSEDLGKYSRLWRHRDSLDVLSKNTGTETVKSLILDQKQVDTENQKSLMTDAFKKMRNLKLLELKDVKLKGSFKNFPSGLVCLCWHQYPSNFIPNCFSLNDLIVLEIQCSKLTQLWMGTQFFQKLKILNLSYCHSLVRTPDFSRMPNLERVMLEDCKNLVKVDESIGCLERLVLLSLKNCTSLIELPEKIGTLQSLEELILWGCSKLLESSRLHCTDEIAINQLQCATRKRRLSNLWCWFYSRKCIESSTAFSLVVLPRSLVHLDLSHCNISDLQLDFSCVPFLSSLILTGNRIQSVSESINSLTDLKGIYLEYWEGIVVQTLPKKGAHLFMEERNSRLCQGLDILWQFRPLMYQAKLTYNFVCEVFINNPRILEELRTSDVIQKVLSYLDYVDCTQVEALSPLGRMIKEMSDKCALIRFYFPEKFESLNWFRYQADGSFLSFIAPHCHKVCSLYVFIRFVLKEEQCLNPLTIRIHNTTKDIGCEYRFEPIFCRGYWVSFLKLKGNLEDILESGNQIEVKMTVDSHCHVEGCGVDIKSVEELEENINSVDEDECHSH